MSFDVNWDVESQREDHECEEHWQLRKAFIERWKNEYPKDRLVCLARVFVNMEFMGCRYPAEVTHEVARLSQDVANDYRKSRKGKLQRTFVSASDAAEDLARGVKREGGIIKDVSVPKSSKIQFVKQGQANDVEEAQEVEGTIRNLVSSRTLVLEKKLTQKSKKSKKDKGSPKTNTIVSKKHKHEKHKGETLKKSPCKKNKDPIKPTQMDQTLNKRFLDPSCVDAAAALPLGLLTNIKAAFFKNSVDALTEFADNENQKNKKFSQLSDDELEFLKKVQSVAESQTLRDTFRPKYRLLLWKFDRKVKEALESCDFTTSVDEKDRSITWKKIPKSSGAVKTPTDSTESSTLPPLKLLTNISEPFFKHTIAALTDFADDATGASRTFSKLTPEQIPFVKKIRYLAVTPKVRELFDPPYRMLLWRLNCSIKKALVTCSISTTVNEEEGSITVHKKPKFATPAPVKPAVRAKIQFKKGGKHPATDMELTTESQQQERGRSMSKQTTKLLEDLSTPLESGIGMRMMRLMGWDGGALGARGDGIMEPVIPTIELFKRSGLGHVTHVPHVTHVSDPKPVPRKPIAFRLMLLHNLLDLVLCDEKNKQLQFKKPMTKKDRRFVKQLLKSVNARRRMSLTDDENELLVKICSRLADFPTMEIRANPSTDFRKLNLQKVLDCPLRALNVKKPKPKRKAQPVSKKVDIQPQPAPKQVDIQPQPSADKVDMFQSQPALKKVDVIISMADVNRLSHQIDISQIDGPVNEQTIRNRALRLLFLMKFADTWSRNQWKQIVFKYQEVGICTPLVTFMRNIVMQLNNDELCLNLSSQEAAVYGNLRPLARGSLLAFEFELPSKIILTRTPINMEDSLPNTSHTFAEHKVNDNNIAKTDNRSQPVNIDDNTKNVHFKVKNHVIKTEKLENEIDTYQTAVPADILEHNYDILKSSVEIKKEETDLKPDICDIELSDLNKDIRNVEMAILNAKADAECQVRTDNNSNVSARDLEIDLSNNDLTLDIKQEKDDSNVSGKRSHSISTCSHELDPKKTKLNTEIDNYFVIIRPKKSDEKITQEIVKEVQTAIAKELDKSGAFLPLLKCHGIQNMGLLYRCHDEDAVEWLKKVISDTNLEIEIVDKKDLCMEKKSRELLININSYIPLDTETIFRKFEIYNVGLDTKFWKVLFKHVTDTFVMLIVTVDEKSFKYISDEKFCLYCGIDQAQFSVIFK